MTDLLCPDCHAPLDQSTLACAAGHRFAREDGVLVLLGERFGRQLTAFLEGFGALRAGGDKRILDQAAYPRLPFGQRRPDDAEWNAEWRLRCGDLALIERLLRPRPASAILEIGAYNGWLSNRLAAAGHHVTALDYFVDQYDGLRAKKFYPSEWRAIQMDLGDLAPLAGRYDCVILNRCLQFFDNPAEYVRQAREKLAPGGLLIATGLGFFGQPQAKARAVAAYRAHLRSHGLDFFKPMKGYLDLADRRALRASGVQIRPYPRLRIANLKAMLSPRRPWHAYGFYRAD